MLQEHQRSLEQKEWQLAESEKRADQAEDRHRVLKEKLSILQYSSRDVAMEAAELLKRREELELKLARNKKRKERLLDQKRFMTDMELLLQMIDEVQLSIDDSEEHIALLKMKIGEQITKEKELHQEIAKKQKEVDDSNRALQASKKKCSLLRSKLNAERMVFDFKLRRQQQSSEKIQEELMVSLIQCEHYIKYIYSEPLISMHSLVKPNVCVL